MIEAATSTFGGLDILVNNAAIAKHAALLDTSEELYDETLAVNLKGTFLACQQAVPALIGTRWRLDRQHRLDRRHS